MMNILFFYGLAFLIMGGVIFTVPKRGNPFDFMNGAWSLGLFAILHGINEWIDLIILMAAPDNINILAAVGSVILPLSFAFLATFGAKVVSENIRKREWIKFLWIPCLLAYFAFRGALGSGIAARYFICFPGAMMAAYGLRLSIFRSDRNAMPPSVIIGAQLVCLAFFLLGVFSGLIVPKASFFPASLINYDNFARFLGFPVQFIRMILAIAATTGFVLMNAFFRFKEDRFKLRGGIRSKVSLIVLSFVTATTIFNFTIAYVTESSTFTAHTGESYAQLAKAFGAAIAESFMNEIEDLNIYATRPSWIKAVEEANEGYKGLDDEAILGQLREKDKIWTDAKDSGDLTKRCLGNEVSYSMQLIARISKDNVKLVITDKFGGLVAASQKTIDFYCADEPWWQKTCALEKGGVYIGRIEMDEISRTWSITIAVPMRSRNDKVIGICKEVIPVEKFFNRLKWFKVDKTGHAVLVDENGEMIFHPGMEYSHQKYYESANIEELLGGKKHYRIVTNLHNHNTKMLIAFDEIDLPVFSENGIRWFVFIDQNADELFAPLDRKLFDLLVTTSLVLILILPLCYYAAGVLTSPIQKLRLGVENILRGDWDYNIDIDTRDEVEELSDSFNEMLSNIKKKQFNLIRAKLELEELNRKLEDKVKDRTRDLMGSQDAVLNMLEDLTETKNKLEEDAKKLERAMQIKSDFTSTVSHELRTPLAAIKESISLVLDGITGAIAPQQREFLSMAKRNVDRLAWLINDILDFQKLESGNMKFNFQENNINGLVKEACETASVLADQKGLGLVIDIEEDMPAVRLDKNKIFQVMNNLLSNAVKFTDKGKITVATSRKDDTVKVSVIDTGGGIKREDIPKLFKQFERLGEPGERKPGGTGLGLSISKGIIENHGGVIWVESEVGKGSAFNFTLPIKGPEAGVIRHL